MSVKDGATRQRVLGVATRLFAARGYEKVTVREICRESSANIAAVNYHFGDKLGLYREVLGAAIEVMQRTTHEAQQAGEGLAPAERLRAYVRVFVTRVAGKGGDSWIHQLMMHELADPTPALDMVIEQVVRPRTRYLATVVSALLAMPATDPRVIRSVASVQSLFGPFLWASPVAKRLRPDAAVDPQSIETWAEHIAVFSLRALGVGEDTVMAARVDAS